MSGHSKWATIKHKKEKTDGQRGKSFTKIGRELAVAVKLGGPDPSQNSRLRDVIAKAKAANMPNDTITRSIKKASGELGSINYEEIQYEGYGAGGVAIIIKALSDNKNRTAADVRHALSKHGGSMGATGCVGWMFEKKGVIVMDAEGTDEDTVMMTALDAGADDFVSEEGMLEISTSPEEFSAVCDTLTQAGYEFISAEVSMIPANTAKITQEHIVPLQKMLDMLEDNDDVQDVYHNAEFEN